MQYYYRNYYPKRRQLQQINNIQPFTIAVEGEGLITVQPNRAKISIGIVTEDSHVQKAQQENTNISNRVINALKQMGIQVQAIQTTVYSIHPRYDFIEGQSILKGYEVEHQLEITVNDLSMVGNIYDTAIQNGANRSGNIEFLVTNRDQYYREALTRAVQNAREKAEEIAKSMGVTIANIPTYIMEKTEQPDRIFPTFSVKAAEFSTDAVPPIQTGKNIIKANVNTIFSYS